MFKLKIIKIYMITFIFYFLEVFSANGKSVGAINQSDYEVDHRGIIVVKVDVYSSPCNLSYSINQEIKESNLLNHKSKLNLRNKLINCGAGSEFSQKNIHQFSAKTPVNITLYNVRTKETFFKGNQKLDNGENNLPFSSLDLTNYRVEISYE